MLIQAADIYQQGLHDLRIEDGIISAIGRLTPKPGETILPASGGTLLPGLIDHHIHFLSYAASLASLDCSPAAMIDQHNFAKQLRQHASGEGWLRGFGYHESLAGDIDRHWLDTHCPHRPVRIQHRTGRLWIFNSAGLNLLRQAQEQAQTQILPPSLPTESWQTGRFFDADRILSSLLGRQLPPVKLASQTLAHYGVTAFCDMTPSNDQNTFALFQQLQNDGAILQDVQLARNNPFPMPYSSTLLAGPVKIHLHENRLPALHELVERIINAHHADIPVAIHCVTLVELLFSISALEEAGPLKGDRIEHAAITPDFMLERMAALGVTVVTQPHFVLEKGDTYLHDIDNSEHEQLYRCRTFHAHNIALAASSDAPFGSADPWLAMRAAVSRNTASGQPLGHAEALSPEAALALFLGSLQTPGTVRQIKIGMPADLCLLKYPWTITRTRLIKEDVQRVLKNGRPIFQRSQHDANSIDDRNLQRHAS